MSDSTHRLIAFTGAGISKASGIPTFEDMGEEFRKKLSRDVFNKNPEELCKALIDMKYTFDMSMPNAAHISLARYGIPIITMNIDGLHKKAGSSKVIEVHGNCEYVDCLQCQTVHPFSILSSGVNCPVCGCVLQPNVVLYGDDYKQNFDDAIDLISHAHEMIIIGTSFFTSTATYMKSIAESRGVKITIFNESAEIKLPLYLEALSDGHGSILEF